MKKWIGKILLSLLVCVICAVTVLIGMSYLNFISGKIYEDSTGHLKEIYAQVNRSFGAFVERNWGLIDGWSRYIVVTEYKETSDSEISDFITEEKQYWGFSDFYFLSSDKKCITVDGEKNGLVLDEVEECLSSENGPVMAGAQLSTGRDVTVFAVPVKHGEYKGFGYDAIAVSYTNEDIVKSLNVNAFSGEALCFVIHDDGKVLLSTQTGGSIFDNYLTYLNAVSDISDEKLVQIKADWRDGKSGLLQCNIGDINYCILYQSVGYQGYMMLSVVPQSAVSAGFIEVQHTTTGMLIAIFLLVSVTTVTIVIIRNYKQSRKNKMELQYRELMFDVLSNSVDDIFIMLDRKSIGVDYISPNIERLIGISAKDARRDIRVMEKCAVNFDVVIPKRELDEIPLNGNKYWECEYMHQHTGERRWYRMTIYHMSIQRIEKYIIVLSDRTLDRQMNKQLEEALTAAKTANEAKSNFLSNMSHDIRTPMNAIVGFSVLLEKDADHADKVREYTRKITASSHYLLSLINDILDMNKIESGKTSLNVDTFSLPQLLEELNIILMPQVKAKQQEFRMHVMGSPPEQIIGDKLRLNQILINLLSNAIKYTPNGGRISFDVSVLTPPASQYAKLKFVVEDNGIGISDEFKKHIFAPFSREISSVTNKIQGTGLGMAITKNLVDLMGGIIEVESEIGKGSTFTVELTFARPDNEESDSWFASNITRMLVADDEEQVCINVRNLMKDVGVEVAIATSGAQAVEKTVEAHESGNDFDIILLDLKMPGMDGVETARRIREKVGAYVPILVLTSNDWTEIEDEARRAGIDAFMAKPFFVSSFRHVVKPLFYDSAVGYGGDDKEKDISADSGESVMKGKLFLVVEDNEINSEILMEMLKIEGASSELAVNGQEAVEMFGKSEPGHYDMILMDVQMPVMNGYEATRRIRSCEHPEAKTIPIVAMTANTFAEDVRDALESGMNGHLGKPIDMNAVRELVGKLFNEDIK